MMGDCRDSCTIMTYNMHGLNQGCELLNHVCERSIFSFIFLQEHWLTPDFLFKLDVVAPGYTCFSVSSMESQTSAGLLRGRPFGGLAILVKESLRKFCSVVQANERFIAVKFCDVLLINVYFPCSSRQDYKDISIDILSQLELVIESSDKVIIGGDFNCNLDVDNWSSNLLSDFMSNCGLLQCNKLCSKYDSLSAYTYVHESLEQYSYLDYFLISKNLSALLSDLQICYDELNFSDHMPVYIQLDNFLKCNFASDVPASAVPIAQGSVADVCLKYRWDHADLMAYYEMTRKGLEPVLNNIKNFKSFGKHDGMSLDENEHQNARYTINYLYNGTVCALSDAAQHIIPRIKVNGLKFWWDQEMKDLKQKAMASNKLWIAAGRPRHGDIFVIRNSDKYKYKNTIKNRKLSERQEFTNDLHEALLHKNMGSFWKIWNKKFGSDRARTSSIIDGTYEPQEIAEKFANYFASTCSPADSKNSSDLVKFLQDFKVYNGGLVDNSHFSVELIDDVVSRMNKGKAAGLDGLTIEHIVHSHPIIYIILKELFYLMLVYGVVPDAFGRGLTIPLPKLGHIKSVMELENFRGITISPVISKIFEHCILRQFSEFLSTSDAQFGFKRNLSCSHAIYSVKQVVDYFVSGGSTVNICTLDISKAFDKVNFTILFTKLMNRNFPKSIIKVLFDWFNNSYICVKWLGVCSSCFRLKSGVRQGGVLSPVLFAIYVDDILLKLHNSNIGCIVKGVVLNSFMYADDLIILSCSLTDLQRLINMCSHELVNLQLSFNVNKCCCLRVGRRFAVTCCKIVIDEHEIDWVSELRYLGVFLKSGHILKCNLEHGKKKFYGCLNSILARTGNKADIVLSLCNSYCVPVLLYGTETFDLNKTEKS